MKITYNKFVYWPQARRLLQLPHLPQVKTLDNINSLSFHFIEYFVAQAFFLFILAQAAQAANAIQKVSTNSIAIKFCDINF